MVKLESKKDSTATKAHFWQTPLWDFWRRPKFRIEMLAVGTVSCVSTILSIFLLKNILVGCFCGFMITVAGYILWEMIFD